MNTIKMTQNIILQEQMRKCAEICDKYPIYTATSTIIGAKHSRACEVGLKCAAVVLANSMKLTHANKPGMYLVVARI